ECANRACSDLSGGRPVMGVPTANSALAEGLIWAPDRMDPQLRVLESEPNHGRPNHAAWRARDEFAPGILANAAILCTESSPLRSATLTCARQCAPSSVHRICCFFAMRWLTTWFTADSAMLLLIGSPLRSRAP